MVSYHIRYLANITQNKLQLLRILILFTESDHAEKVKRYDSFILLGLSFFKSFKINLASKGLSGKSYSPNALTIEAALLQGLADKSLNPRKFASVCTDGASVMPGEQNGLAGLLQREFPMILTFHCVCHR